MSSHNDSFVKSGNSPTDSSGPDFLIENHGSIFLFRMNTPAAHRWVSENVQDDAQFLGDALVVEHRYARDLAAGIVADGLEVS